MGYPQILTKGAAGRFCAVGRWYIVPALNLEKIRPDELRNCRLLGDWRLPRHNEHRVKRIILRGLIRTKTKRLLKKVNDARLTEYCVQPIQEVMLI